MDVEGGVAGKVLICACVCGSDNDFGAEGVQALVPALMKMNQLLQLHLSGK